ncbi:MAG: hypothetical protein ABI644_15155 [Arenimonas sp.]
MKKKIIRWQQTIIVFIASLILAPLVACSAPAVEKNQSIVTVSKKKGIVKKASGHQQPVWPNNGIAQREFYGNQMFVEQTKTDMRAWIISEYARWPEWNKKDIKKKKGEVLDFFSGKTDIVYPGYTDDGHSLSEFKTLKGVPHYSGDIPRPIKDDYYPLYDFINVGLRNNLENLDFDSGVKSPFRSQGLQSTCPLRLSAVLGLPIGMMRNDDFNDPNDQRKKAVWRKVVLYHEPPSQGCPSGRWESDIITALSLGDGTFLAVTHRYVYRLTFSDLSPVGSAPALNVLDVEFIEEALEKALIGIDPKAVVDQQDFLTKALKLVPSKAPKMVRGAK